MALLFTLKKKGKQQYQDSFPLNWGDWNIKNSCDSVIDCIEAYMSSAGEQLTRIIGTKYVIKMYEKSYSNNSNNIIS